MNIYCIGMRSESFVAGQYAHFAAIDGWKYLRPPCSVCGWHWQVRCSPICVRWEPSSSVIGDFSYNGSIGDYGFAVTARMVRLFRHHGFDCAFLPLEYANPKRVRKTVPFPYTGPVLKWVECRAIVPLDMQASHVVCESSCSACGDTDYTFKYKDIVIRRRDWSGEMMFRIKTNGWSIAKFITEEARDIILESGATNLICSLAGEIIK